MLCDDVPFFLWHVSRTLYKHISIWGTRAYTKYLLLERKLVLIYRMTNILQYLMSLIQSKIHQTFINFQHRIRKMCWSLISTKKSLSHLKVLLMNKFTITRHVENSSSIPVYKEGRDNIGNILKILDPFLMKSELWFYILKFVS